MCRLLVFDKVNNIMTTITSLRPSGWSRFCTITRDNGQTNFHQLKQKNINYVYPTSNRPLKFKKTSPERLMLPTIFN